MSQVFFKQVLDKETFLLPLWL